MTTSTTAMVAPPAILARPNGIGSFIAINLKENENLNN